MHQCLCLIRYHVALDFSFISLGFLLRFYNNSHELRDGITPRMIDIELLLNSSHLANFSSREMNINVRVSVNLSDTMEIQFSGNLINFMKKRIFQKFISIKAVYLWRCIYSLNQNSHTMFVIFICSVPAIQPSHFLFSLIPCLNKFFHFVTVLERNKVNMSIRLPFGSESSWKTFITHSQWIRSMS